MKYKRILFVVAILCLAAASPSLAAERKLEATFAPEGLEQVRWAGEDLLGEGRPHVSRIVLEQRTLNEKGLYEYAFETPDTANPRTSFDRERQILTYAYDWGAIDFVYAVRDNQLRITTTLRNASDRTVARFDITPLRLLLPEAVDATPQWERTRMATMPGDLNLVEAVFGSRKLLLCGETVMPLQFGFERPRNGNRELPVRLRGDVNILPPGGVVYHHYGLPRVEPGESLAIGLSLRLTEAEADVFAVAADVIEAFRAHHRPGLDWKDRRPVGMLFIGQGFGPENNPRFWLRDPNLDVRTDAGRAELHERMMREAERSIHALQSVGAQGMVVWDAEGAENPHPITYIGDPRMVEIVAPEMVDVYPDYFRKFQEAGLRTGVCIRPTQVYLTPFSAAVDGDLDTRWSVRTFPQWIELDLGAEREIDQTQLIGYQNRAYRYLVEARTEGGEYAVVVDRRENDYGGSLASPITDAFEPVKARYVKLTVTGAHAYDGEWCSIAEFRVFAGDGENLALNRAVDTSRRYGRAVGGHGTGAHDPERNPLGDDFGDIWPEGVPAERFYPIVERMSRKIAFAQKQWGCTLFYIDTNGVHRPVGEGQTLEWTLLGPYVWRELQRRHPDVLLIPEFSPTRGQFAYAASYLQPPYSAPVLPKETRRIFPGAFGVTQTVNLEREAWQALRSRLLAGVAAGDSMFFRGWFGCSYNPLIKDVYAEAAKTAPFHVTVQTAGIEANGDPLADAGALRKWLQARLPETPAVQPRRVVVRYRQDIPLADRATVHQAIVAAGGILAWTAEDGDQPDL